VLLKGKIMTTDQIVDLPDGYHLGVSQKGWTSDMSALYWLQIFDEQTRLRTVGRYRMLIFDGHGSHITVPFLEYCEEHNIVPFCLPPHSTHLLQPLDIGCFQAL